MMEGGIPASIGNLSSLEVLNLSGSRLEGVIPSEIGNLQKLTELYLSGNSLSGSIPASICTLANLTTLKLNINQLEGAIPLEIGNLSALKVLYLNGNKLEGVIPSQIGNLSKLTDLVLSNNILTGAVPAEINKLTTLKRLNLSNNKLIDLPPLNVLRLLNCHLNYNYFDFWDLKKSSIYTSEPNFAFNYGNQRNVSVTRIDKQTSVRLVIPEQGDNIVYEWYKNDIKISDNGSYIEKTIEEKGKYHCKMTCYLFPDLTLYTEPEYIGVFYIITYSANEGGLVLGTASQTVNHGASGSEVEAVPNTGYHFVKWSDNVTTAKRTDSNVTDNLSVSAEFAVNTGINEITENFKVYPNPFLDNIIVNNGDRISRYKILNLLGQEIIAGIHDKASILNLNCTNIMPGCYILILQGVEGEMYSAKILKK